MRRAVRRLAVLLASTPLVACALFEGPSDYPPRDGGAGSAHDATSADSATDGAVDASGVEASTGDAQSDALSSDSEAGGPLTDSGRGDASDAGDAAQRADSPATCDPKGAPCQSQQTCCSSSCNQVSGKCD